MSKIQKKFAAQREKAKKRRDAQIVGQALAKKGISSALSRIYGLNPYTEEAAKEAEPKK